MQTKEQILKDCTINGLIVKLPNIILDRKLYKEVAKSIERIGGKWKGGKVMGFVFNQDPKELLAQIASGEKRNLKKEFQFFATPDKIADRLVALADIEDSNSILEPSAGQGAIIAAIKKAFPRNMKSFDDHLSITIDYFELMPVNNTILESKFEQKIIDVVGVSKIGNNFLDEKCSNKYDRIIANPPFSKNQDIDHVMRMWELLNPGGRIVTITSTHWIESNNKKERIFSRFLADQNAAQINIEAMEFKESGTSIPTIILVIEKNK